MQDLQQTGEQPSGIGSRLIAVSVSLMVIVTTGFLEASSASASGSHRGYEMVSPPDKNGGQITLGAGSIRASAIGNAVAFDSNVASDDAKGTGAGAVVTYRSERSATTWTTAPLMPAQAVNVFGTFNAPSFRWFAADLSRALLQAGEPALAPGAMTNVPNLYLTDGHGQSPQLLTPTFGPVIGGAFNGIPVVDASDDGQSVAFESIQTLTPNAPAQSSFCINFQFGCRPRVYVWEGGTVRLAGILPAGGPAPGGVVAGPPVGAALSDATQALSQDGTRLYFTTTTNGLLYLRNGDTSTAWVSESEASAPEAAPGQAVFRGAAADGARGVFMTNEHLLDSDGDTSSDVYLYTDSANPATDANLTHVSLDSEPLDGLAAAVNGVVGVSHDGSRVYFVANGQLVLGKPINARPKLYLWDAGTVRYIASLVATSQNEDGLNWYDRASSRSSRITEDGRYLVFETSAALTPGFDNAGHKEVYRYDAGPDEIICISCGSGVGPATADATIKYPAAAATLEYASYEPRALSGNGRRVFFNTAEPLEADDVNGVIDAYVWDAGSVELISGGQDGSPSYFVDASVTGDDSYFVTREQLVAQDRDNVLDLYDARIGGGLPEPPIQRAPCVGETCQGSLAAPRMGFNPASNAIVRRKATSARGEPRLFVRRVRAREKVRWAKTGTITLWIRTVGRGRVTVVARTQSKQLATTSRRSLGLRWIPIALRLPKTATRHLDRTGRLRLVLGVTFGNVRGTKRMWVTLAASAGSRRGTGAAGR